MKKDKKWYNPKNEQHAKHSILLRDNSTWVTFEQSTSISSHPGSICRSSVPLHFQSWPQILYPSLQISHFSISEKLCHRLQVIIVLQVVFPVSLLVSCYCSNVVITWVSFYVDPLYESNLSWTSVSMIFVLWLISSFWFDARVGWCGMHQCPPSNGLSPSTLAHYLGPRLETYIVPWGLQSLAVGCSSLSIVGLHYCLLIDKFCKQLDSNKSISPCLECTAGTSTLIIISDESSRIG